MPTYYKIGRTSHCPMKRACQLSSSSGVPHPFDVICHIKTDDAAADESHLHRFLADFRHIDSREFFRFVPWQMSWVVGLFVHHPRASSVFIAQGWRKTRYLKDEDGIENPWAAMNDDGDPEMTEVSPDRVYTMDVVF